MSCKGLAATILAPPRRSGVLVGWLVWGLGAPLVLGMVLLEPASGEGDWKQFILLYCSVVVLEYCCIVVVLYCSIVVLLYCCMIELTLSLTDWMIAIESTLLQSSSIVTGKWLNQTEHHCR